MKISIKDAGVCDISGTGNSWQVVAETARGEVYVHNNQHLRESTAKKLAARVNKVKEITPDLWNFWRTLYCSEAGREEEEEACQYADMIRGGFIHEEDVPDTLRSWL
jgi:hypothetical protein